jgi:hypothetical protein
MRLIHLPLLALLLPGCASLTQRDRLAVGVLGGAAAGAAGGSILSPNAESQSLNALVFGLSGALTGGLIALFTDRPPQTKPEDRSLKARELQSGSSQQFVIPPSGELPEFVKKRLTPVVVEEFEERDSIAEDGSLRAPHKVYRIKRQAELITRPSETEAK